MKNEQTELISRRFSRGTLITAKAGFILFLVLLAIIPLMLVKSTISERNTRYSQAVAEISQAWSHAQHISGPVLIIPYSVSILNKDNNLQKVIKNMVCLPESLEINANVEPEKRYRGMFEAVVYKSNLEIKGVFSVPSLTQMDQFNFLKGAELLWNSGKLVLGITDMRRLKGELTLNWNGQSVAFSPDSGATSFLRSAIQASALNLKPATSSYKIPFSFKLHLDGSDSMHFLPFGMTTNIAMQSTWPHPSFIGAFLPEHRQITNEGFKASWEISHFGRAYPQIFGGDQMTDAMNEVIGKSSFGVRFLQPVDTYRQSERAIKYGMLFIIFTFLVYFLFELITGIRIHIFQYTLVGIALCVFFLLLVALAEHIGFGWAYSLGAAFVIGQISFYSLRVVKTLKRTLTVSAVLTLLYVYLYVALRLEDYALLIGSFGLFLSLTFIMFAVRNVDWFAETKDQPKLQ